MLIWGFAAHIGFIVGFVVRWLIIKRDHLSEQNRNVLQLTVVQPAVKEWSLYQYLRGEDALDRVSAFHHENMPI